MNFPSASGWMSSGEITPQESVLFFRSVRESDSLMESDSVMEDDVFPTGRRLKKPRITRGNVISSSIFFMADKLIDESGVNE